jgi:outer membrane protein TolC
VLDALGPDTLQALALQRRFELGAALADYAVAEAEVRLEVARQYPDLTIGPGLAWDQGIARWIFSFGTPGFPHRANRGPIAESEARRTTRAARVSLLQDSVLAEVDAAVATCRDARVEVAAADSLVATTRVGATLTENAYRRGEIGLTEVAFARLAVLRAERVLRAATVRRAAAGVALESAVGSWLVPTPIRWPDLSAPPPAADAPP